MLPDSIIHKFFALRGFLDLGIYSFSSFHFFVFGMDSLAERIFTLCGILDLVLYSLCFLQFFKFCMDTVNLNGHVAALVSHQGNAATASWDSMTVVTFTA
jgi:hypothetical protein